MWAPQLSAKKINFLKNVDKPEYSPPIFSLITSEGLKIIEARNGDLEIYNLVGDFEEKNNLTTKMSSENINRMKTLISSMKSETGFCEVTETNSNFYDLSII